MLTAHAVRWLPQYATHLPFCNNRVGVVRDSFGAAHLYGVPYSSEGLSHVFLVDVETGECRKFRIPGDENGAYCDVLGTDGRLYLGTFGGRLLAFDPKTKSFEHLCAPFEGQPVWGGTSTTTGKILFGTYPTGSFGVWDVANRKLEYIEIGKFAGSVYANTFCELPDNRVFVAVGGAQEHIGLYDPIRRRTEWCRPPWLEGRTFLFGPQCLNNELVLRTFPQNELMFIQPKDLSLVRRIENVNCHLCTLQGSEGEELWALDVTTGKLFVFQDNALRHVATPVPYESGYLCSPAPSMLCTITEHGTYVRYDVKSGKTFSRELDATLEGGMVCSALASDGNNRLFITPYINQRLIEMDLCNGCSREIGRNTDQCGQVPVMRWHDERLWMAYYGTAGISVYDPSKPYRLRENPKVLGIVGNEQYRPRGPMELYDGRLYYTTSANYGKLGGAIVIVDPQTETWRHFRNVIPDQNPLGLVFDRTTGLFFTAGEITGDCGSCIPKAKCSEWIAWDPKTEKRVAGGALEDCQSASVLACVDGKLLIQKRESKMLWVIDTRTMTVSDDHETLPPEDCRPINVIVRASNGKVYAIGGGHLFHWNPATGETQKILPCKGRHLIEAAPGRLIFNENARLAEFCIDQNAAAESRSATDATRKCFKALYNQRGGTSI